MNKVVLVIPNFGSFKNYFDFFLNSCEKNSSIDFMFFTDNKVALEKIASLKSGHIKSFYMTLYDLKKIIEAKLNLQVSLESPYKLCDYKPMYGLIFEDYIKDYSFWGHCDNDLIFGDISSFITQDILDKYERILSRGHLTIYKNIPPVNNFFKKSDNSLQIPNWKSVVTSPHSFSFDEWPGISQLWANDNQFRMFDEILFDDITFTKKHFLSYQKQVKKLDSNFNHFIFVYDSGKLYRVFWDRKEKSIKYSESLYVHFQKRDMSVKTQNTDQYLMIPNEFIDLQSIDKKRLFRWGRRYFFYSKIIKFRFHRLFYKIKILFRS